MNKNKKILFTTCLLALYIERELACRNLGYWINNTENTLLENLWLFTQPYLLVTLTFFLLTRKNRLSIIPIMIGISETIIITYNFIDWELWQMNNFDQYELFTMHDSIEIRTIYTIIVKIVYYLNAYTFYKKVCIN